MYLLKRDDQQYPFAVISDIDTTEKMELAIGEELGADRVMITKCPKYVDWGDVETIECTIESNGEDFEIEISITRVVNY